MPDSTYQVRMTARAERDVERVLAWFCTEEAEAAGQRWLDQLRLKLQTLETRPDRCPLSPYGAELGIQLRELFFGRRGGRYSIYIRTEMQMVSIVHIRHSARRPLGD